jgi:lipoyl(octanoyl) transferase
MNTVEIKWHGRVAYQTAWEWQKGLAAERKGGQALPGKLLLLEHPPTYTLGRNGRLENLLLNEEELAEQGIGLFRVERGGDITYHGPGQLVGYPILDLRRVYAGFGLGRVRHYVTDLEEVLIRTLAAFGINGRRHEKHRGVWVESAVETFGGLAKIAAIGVRISGGVSSHGFALNVEPDLSYFSGIVPCGITEFGVTSMARELGRKIGIEDVLPCLTTFFRDVFLSNPQPDSDISKAVLQSIRTV